MLLMMMMMAIDDDGLSHTLHVHFTRNADDTCLAHFFHLSDSPSSGGGWKLTLIGLICLLAQLVKHIFKKGIRFPRIAYIGHSVFQLSQRGVGRDGFDFRGRSAIVQAYQGI